MQNILYSKRKIGGIMKGLASTGKDSLTIAFLDESLLTLGSDLRDRGGRK